MGVLFGFLVGWVVGARGGRQGYEEVVTAARDVVRSQEMATLSAALRLHAEYTLRQLADWLQETRESGMTTEDVMLRARRLFVAEQDDEDAL